MGMTIEAIAVVTYTCELSDEDVERVKEWIDFNRSEYMDGKDYAKEEIIDAISELSSDLEIQLYRESTESDFMTHEIRWSEFEEREPQEIFENV